MYLSVLKTLSISVTAFALSEIIIGLVITSIGLGFGAANSPMSRR